MDSKYLNSSLWISDVYLDKFKSVKIIPEGVSDETIREDLQNEFLSYWIPLREKLTALHYTIKDSVENFLKIKFPNTSCNDFTFRVDLGDLPFNLFNDYLKLRINEVSLNEWEKESQNSLLAYAIKSRSESLEVIKRQVLSKNDPEKFRESLKKDRFEIKANRSLRDKLSELVYSTYSEFLDAAIEYLTPDPQFASVDRKTYGLPEADRSSEINLQSQFKVRDKYEEVVLKLIENGNLRKDVSGKLIFIKGHRHGTKYGVDSLRMALNELDYLTDQKIHTIEVLKEIHRNTFKDFHPSDKTINPVNKEGYLKCLNYFKEVLR